MFNEDAPQFSPDGKWIAYSSDETGRPEIFIQPFPATGAKWQVSDQGGELPKWRGDGKELYFYSNGRIRAAGLQLRARRVEIDRSRDLFALTRVTGPLYFYEVAPDGQRFLVNQPRRRWSRRPQNSDQLVECAEPMTPQQQIAYYRITRSLAKAVWARCTARSTLA
jgi:hypothetical protein